jgi:xylan 1,4-beta-xylosidase
VARFPSFKNTPIYVTEADPDGCAACPVSSEPANAYRTSPAYGAYELAMMKHSLELESALGVRLAGILTWAFTFPGTPYFAGYRALTTNGIDLPVLGAFKLLGQLSGTRLPLTSTGAHALDELLLNSVRDQPEIDGIATRDVDGIKVLVWNYHDDLVTVPETPVHLSIQLPSDFGSSVRVSHLRVDESHGDAHTTWLAQGMPAKPSSAQVRALEQAMSPERLVPDKTVQVSADGSVAVDFELPRFGVSLLTLRPDVAGGAPSAAGGSSTGNGCACRFGNVGGNAQTSALLEMTAVALLAMGRRRRSIRAKVLRTMPFM